MPDWDKLNEYERVRSKVEMRLAPRLSLYRQRMWLFVHIVAFVIVNLVFWSWWNGPAYYISQEIVPVSPGSDSFTDTYPTTVTHPHPVFLIISIGWFLLLVFQTINLWDAFRREGLIEREINQEIQLEQLRLKVELLRQQNGTIRDEILEKPKRGFSLDNDGELLSMDEYRTVLPQPRNHRRQV